VKTWKIMLALLLISLSLVAILPIGKTLESVHAATSSTPPPTAWSKTYGGTRPDYALSVNQTSDNGYALAGYTSSFGAGGDDAWLVKTDSSGNIQWKQTYGGTGGDYASSVVKTSDGGYALAGSTDSIGAGSQDMWLIKTDSDGNMQWNKTFGGAGYDYASSVIQTSDGGYALVGYTDSFGAGSADAWLVRTDPNGNMLWNQTFGGKGYDEAYSVQTSNGGYVLAGATTSFGAGFLDFWLINTDAFGKVQWNQTYGGTGDDEGYSVVQTTDNGYAIAGYTNSSGHGGYDGWLIKTDSSGNMQWNQTYGGTGGDHVYSMLQTRYGGYALSGVTNSFGTGAEDAWLINTDSAGNIQWNQTYGGVGTDTLYSAVETSDGGYALAGSTSSFGAGNTDFWLVKTEGSSLSPTPTSTASISPSPSSSNAGIVVYVAVAIVAILIAVVVTAAVLRKKGRLKTGAQHLLL